MLFGDHIDSLGIQIVEILAQSKHLSIAQIDARLMQDYSSITSTATLYRRLSDLIDSQVVLRLRRRYMLNPLWVKSMLHFAARLNSTQQTKLSNLLDLPKREGEVREIQARSLLQLDPLWNLILLELHRNSKSKAWFGYNSHAWHAVGMTSTERVLLGAMLEQGARIRFTLGHRTDLDLHGLELISQPGLTLDALATPINQDSGYAAWTNNEYLVECHFPKETKELFADWFKPETKPDELNLSAYREIFAKKLPYTLRVRKSAKQSAALIDKLTAF